MWWLVWPVLVVGWLVGAFFGLRWLWRRAKALGAALAGLEQVADRLAAAAAALPQPTPVPPPSVFTDPADPALRERVVARRQARAAAKANRRARQAARRHVWAVLAGRAR
jgi:hypothetical protein